MNPVVPFFTNLPCLPTLANIHPLSLETSLIIIATKRDLHSYTCIYICTIDIENQMSLVVLGGRVYTCLRLVYNMWDWITYQTQALHPWMLYNIALWKKKNCINKPPGDMPIWKGENGARINDEQQAINWCGRRFKLCIFTLICTTIILAVTV